MPHLFNHTVQMQRMLQECNHTVQMQRTPQEFNQTVQMQGVPQEFNHTVQLIRWRNAYQMHSCGMSCICTVWLNSCSMRCI